MKTLIILAVLTLTTAVSNSQTVPVSDNLNYSLNETGYTLFSYTDPLNKFALIEFAVKNGDFVKIYVTDESGNTIQSLVEGEPGEGSNRIIFRFESGNAVEFYVCRMDVYSNENSRLIYTADRIISGIKYWDKHKIPVSDIYSESDEKYFFIWFFCINKLIYLNLYISYLAYTKNK